MLGWILGMWSANGRKTDQLLNQSRTASNIRINQLGFSRTHFWPLRTKICTVIEWFAIAAHIHLTWCKPIKGERKIPGMDSKGQTGWLIPRFFIANDGAFLISIRSVAVYKMVNFLIVIYFSWRMWGCCPPCCDLHPQSRHRRGGGVVFCCPCCDFYVQSRHNPPGAEYKIVCGGN